MTGVTTPGMLCTTALVAVALSGAACRTPEPASPESSPARPRPAAESGQRSAPTAPGPRIITVVGTNDLHGHLRALPVLGGYVERLRELRRDDGGVLLVDAGDAFQGTLESNLNEGAAVVQAYAALGYDAVAVGNHEFDYGPEGDGTSGPVFGALRARLAQSPFPWLSANLIHIGDGARPRWKNLHDGVLKEVGGVSVGIAGVLTAETPEIVLPKYFAGLNVTSPAEALATQAQALRARGARMIVAAAHAGGECTALSAAHDTSSCKADAEIMAVVRALPRGAVDVIVAGHTHKAMAHVIDGVAVVEAWSYGRGFSRVDLRVTPGEGARLERVHPPRELCASGSTANDTCVPGEYEGRAIAPAAKITTVIAPALEAARAARDRPLGARAVGTLTRAYDRESEIGNLFADLLLAQAPDAQVAIVNGGGLRADLPDGELTYGHVYEAMPFDNLVARVTLTGAELRRVLARHLSKDRGGIVSLAGVTLVARCKRTGSGGDDGAGVDVDVELRDRRGRVVKDDQTLVIVTSDYLATGGDGLFADVVTDRRRQIGVTLLRDALAAGITREKTLRAGTWLDAKRPRLRLPGGRPVCR